jgi:hypothetical protein
MTVDNILGNLAASLIWFILFWQVSRLRKQLRTDQRTRNEIAERMERVVQETHPIYSAAFRQDDILSIEILMNISRRLQSEAQTVTLFSAMAFFQQLTVTFLFPKDSLAKILLCVIFLTMCSNAYYTLKHSRDVDAFEMATLNGLKKRNAEKLNEFRQAVAKSNASAEKK